MNPSAILVGDLLVNLLGVRRQQGGLAFSIEKQLVQELLALELDLEIEGCAGGTAEAAAPRTLGEQHEARQMLGFVGRNVRAELVRVDEIEQLARPIMGKKRLIIEV